MQDIYVKLNSVISKIKWERWKTFLLFVIICYVLQTTNHNQGAVQELHSLLTFHLLQFLPKSEPISAK